MDGTGEPGLSALLQIELQQAQPECWMEPSLQNASPLPIETREEASILQCFSLLRGDQCP